MSYIPTKQLSHTPNQNNMSSIKNPLLKLGYNFLAESLNLSHNFYQSYLIIIEFILSDYETFYYYHTILNK